MTALPVDSSRLDEIATNVMRRCDELAGCSEEPDRLTRPFPSAAMQSAHGKVSDWMRAAGLEVRVDAIGNIIGRRAAADNPGAPAVMIGSHLDTVPNAGRYDGILGVMAGIAAAEALRAANLPFALEVIGFCEEEGVRFRTPYLGSRAVEGIFGEDLLKVEDDEGISLAEALRQFGLDPDTLAEACRRPEELLGYVELHIEQGPVLESLGLPVGIVEGIAGQERLRLAFEGRSGHAGTTPMESRADAAVAAARFVLEVQDKALRTGDLRATVGTLQLFPNVRNVIAGRAELSLDLRHPEDRPRVEAVEALIRDGHSLAQATGTKLSVLERSSEPAVAMDSILTERLSEAVGAAGHTLHRMVSGAGHDAAVMAGLCPTAMLFVRNPGGISHHPDERVEIEDVRAALEVLLRFLMQTPKP